jgi:hypothetical protein
LRDTSSVRESQYCRNCAAHAPEEYCPRCGQETNEHLPTAREFVHEFVLHYFAAEGRLWRTLAALVLHPGRLTVEYLRGHKRAYVLPLRLYLTVSVVFFLIFKFASAPGAERANAEFHRVLNDGHSSLTVGFPHAEAVRHANGSFTCHMPNWLCERVKQRMLVPKDELERRLAGVSTELIGHMPSAMFVLLPLFAFFLQLAFIKRTYGEHFLFALHVHSFWFLMLLVLLLPLPVWLQWVCQGYLFVYSVAALRAVYRAGWLKTLIKGAAIGVVYVACLIAVTDIISFVAFVA